MSVMIQSKIFEDNIWLSWWVATMDMDSNDERRKTKKLVGRVGGEVL